jgi:hypothetical protein
MHMNDEIALRAYRIYEKEGRPEGRALEHWLAAERLVRQENQPARARESTAIIIRQVPSVSKGTATPANPPPAPHSPPTPAVTSPARAEKPVAAEGRSSLRRFGG